MDFIPKQHLEMGNYVKYLDEILQKCEKGIEYCKICPNEFVCTELEKDDFGLKGSTISDILHAIQYALNKIPGYLHYGKRNELREHIKKYINESPVDQRSMWEDSIFDILLDDKLANPSYKPEAKIGKIRTLLTYNNKISFSVYLKCLRIGKETIINNITSPLSHDVTSNSTKVVNHFIQTKHINIAIPRTNDSIKYYLDKGMPEIIQRCNLNDIGLAAALCYYSALTRLSIPEYIAVIGSLDIHGRVQRAESILGKIETVLRELHFIDRIIIPKGNSISIPVPKTIKIIEVDDLEQAIDNVFKNDVAI